MIQIREAMGEVDYQDFYEMADSHGMIPDLWKLAPDLAGLLHENRIYFEILNDGEVIGYIWADGYFKGLPFQEDLAISAMVGKEWRGRWAHEARPQLEELLRVLFEDLNAQRLSVYVGQGRRNVERFFNRLGFSFECLRTDAVRIKGKARTVAQLRLTQREWKHGIPTASSHRSRDESPGRTVRKEAAPVRVSGNGGGSSPGEPGAGISAGAVEGPERPN